MLQIEAITQPEELTTEIMQTEHQLMAQTAHIKNQNVQVFLLEKAQALHTNRIQHVKAQVLQDIAAHQVRGLNLEVLVNKK